VRKESLLRCDCDANGSPVDVTFGITIDDETGTLTAIRYPE
jgi:hypothetical protein